jgi:hypothetical protein
MLKPCNLNVLLCVLLISSCTIDKRRYQPGFHVDWNKSGSHEKVPPQNHHPHETEIPSHSATLFDQSNYTLITEISLPETNSAILDDKTLGKEEIQERNKLRQKDHHDETRKAPLIINCYKGQTLTDSSEKNQHKGAKVSFIFGVITCLLLLISFLLLLFSGPIVADIIYVFLLVATFTALPASIIGRRAQKQIDKKPEFYSNKWQADWGLSLGMFWLAILFTFLIFLLAFGSMVLLSAWLS